MSAPSRTYQARLPADTEQQRADELASPFGWRRLTGAGGAKTDPGNGHWNILRISRPVQPDMYHPPTPDEPRRPPYYL